MKKVLMMVAMMATAICANAQYEPGTISIQPYIGANGATLTNMEKFPVYDKMADNQAIGGSVVGVDFEYQVTNFLGLSAGINYSMQGTGWKDTKLTIDSESMECKDIKMETGYFNIPVIANIYLYKGLAIKGGVQFGFLTNADFKYTEEAKIDSRKVTQNTSVEMKDDFKKVDISIPIGISYEFNNHLVLDARYNLGLSKVNKVSEAGEKDSKNSVFRLTLGYKIGL